MFWKIFCKTLNSKKFLGTRFPGSDTFSTPDAPSPEIEGNFPLSL
jgi:hypothetical protein